MSILYFGVQPEKIWHKNLKKICIIKIKSLPLHSLKQSSKRAAIKIALWCNGSTSDSGSACEGSNPSKATQRKQLTYQLLSYFFTIFDTESY